MKAEFYLKVTKSLSEKTTLAKAIVDMSRAITLFIYAFYPCFLAAVFILCRESFLKTLLVPFVSFMVLSVARYFINAPRPYEKIEGLEPLYEKKTAGKSFPSRHTFSGFVIGTVALFFNTSFGGFLLLLSLILAVFRVLCGVHFVRDVIVGALFGIVSGVFGMMLF